MKRKVYQPAIVELKRLDGSEVNISSRRDDPVFIYPSSKDKNEGYIIVVRTTNGANHSQYEATDAEEQTLHRE